MTTAQQDGAPGARADTLAREAQILGAPPRIAPLNPDEAFDLAMENTASLRKAASRSADNLSLADIPELVFTLLKHPDLYQAIAGLSIQLLGRGRLSPRDRELVVLRVAWLWQALRVGRARQAGARRGDLQRRDRAGDLGLGRARLGRA